MQSTSSPVSTDAAAEAGPVTEFTARLLFQALRDHAESVEQQLRLLDEKDAGYRGDAHLKAILELLATALA